MDYLGWNIIEKFEIDNLQWIGIDKENIKIMKKINDDKIWKE